MMCLSEIAQGVKGELIGNDARIGGVSTDTRVLNRGELFVALKGPNFDGHNFVDTARDKGAAGAMLQVKTESSLPIIKVADTRKALGDLAGTWRARFSIPVVAVTGSNGKTTVKEMIGSIVGADTPALISTGNLNNDIGVPLVLCGLRPEHHCAVIEMGMNHPGEIAYLARLTKPTVAVITNASPAHLEGLGSLESVADAKGEIMTGFAAGGVAVLNRDDLFFDHWRRMAADRAVFSFGFDESADVYASDYSEPDNRFRLHVRDQSIDVLIRLTGRHNVSNALAAAAAAFATGSNLEQIKNGLARVEPVPGRLCIREGVDGVKIIDDSYNANPASVAAGIRVLAMRPGRRIMVFGDMGELGPDAGELHEQVGRQARREGIDEFYGFGDLSRSAVQAFGPAGCHYSDRDELVARLKSRADGGTTFLIKGSRFMHMDEIANALASSPREKEGGRH